MVRSSFAILFFIRESRVRKDGTTSIEVVLTVNGERCSFSTGKKVKATSWDKNKQLVKGKDEEATSLNNYLKSVRAKLYEKEAELLDRGFVITAQLLYDAYFDKVACLKERSLLNVLSIDNLKQALLFNITDGLGKTAYSSKVAIAGIQGTTLLTTNEDTTQNEYVAEFYGCFPADNPKYSIFVSINKTDLPVSGGLMAGDVFRQIAE